MIKALFVSTPGESGCRVVVDGKTYGEGRGESIETVINHLACDYPRETPIEFRYLENGAAVFSKPTTLHGWLEVFRLKRMTKAEREAEALQGTRGHINDRQTR